MKKQHLFQVTLVRIDGSIRGCFQKMRVDNRGVSWKKHKATILNNFKITGNEMMSKYSADNLGENPSVQRKF